MRSETNKIIEQARAKKQIGNSLEAQVTLYAKPNLATSLRILGNELCFLLLTSSAIVADYHDAKHEAVECDGLHGLKIMLEKATGKKCLRCWQYKTDIGLNINNPKICGVL